ncbi:MAG: nucleotidyltransferase family protein [Butyrivibrio sp.]|nr:nucleotidyltransferase family protein [Butyrivibrio sp.]
MNTKLSKEQRLLCLLLSQTLNGEPSRESAALYRQADMKEVIRTAQQHKVLPLLYGILCEERQGEVPDVALDAADVKWVESISRTTVRQSYHLLFLTCHLVRLLEAAGVPVLVLKGSGVAELYPVPELRKSGDVDVLIPGDRLEAATELLTEKGFAVGENQHANHHLVFNSGDGIDLELHTMLAEPFRDSRINRCMERLLPACFAAKEYRDCMGFSFPMLAESFQALQLLLHMLQHFLRAGFGLKLLCDWVVFWNRDEAREVVPEFLKLAEECNVREFSETITMVCKEFLGLRGDLPMGRSRDRKLAEEFLQDVFAAEEFGKADRDRMVIVQENSLWAYIKEFHYQMKMNHPKTSRYVILWPGLWVITLVVFLRNNRKLNRGRVKDILRNAGNRSRLLQQMGLDK